MERTDPTGGYSLHRTFIETGWREALCEAGLVGTDFQHLGQGAGTTVLVDIVDALAELPGCRRPSEDLLPTLERLEQAETQIAKLVSELDRKTAI